MIFFFSSLSFAKEIIRLSSGEWKPYISTELKYNGVVSRIVTEAFSLEGVMVEYECFPWARAYEHAKHGVSDGSFAWSKKAGREAFFWFSNDVLTTGRTVFFHLKEFQLDWEYKKQNFESLRGIKIGGIIGYRYKNAFEVAEESGKIWVERVPNGEINFRKLLAGRINIAINEETVGHDILANNFEIEQRKLITTSPMALTRTDYYLILSKKLKRNKRLMALFNKGLKRLKESGKYDQYIAESKRGEYIIQK